MSQVDNFKKEKRVEFIKTGILLLWWAEQDLNLRPPACEAGALTTEPSAHLDEPSLYKKIWWARQDSNLEPTGYEPAALPLSYGPNHREKL